MSTKAEAVEWIFEGPDPSVGIFGDLVVHPCQKNTEEDQAVEVGVKHADDGKVHTITTTFRCPACGATTTATDTQPSDAFDEEPDEYPYEDAMYLAAGDGSAQRYFTETSL